MLRKFILASLVVCLLCVGTIGGGYAFLNWRAQSYAESINDFLPSGVAITYDAVDIEVLEKAVTLHNVMLQAPAFVEDAEFVSVRIVVPSWLTFLSLEDELKAGRLPEAIQVQPQGLVVDLDNPLFVNALEVHKSSINQTSAKAHFCGSGGGLALFSSVGYNAIVADSEIGIYTPPGRGLRIVELKTRLRELGELHVEAVFHLPDNFSGSFDPETAPIKEVRVHFQDLGYNQRYRTFCRRGLKLDDNELDELLKTTTVRALGERGLVGYQQDMEALTNIYKPQVMLAGIMPLGETYQQALADFSDDPKQYIAASKPLLSIGGQVISKPFLHAAANNFYDIHQSPTDIVIAPVPAKTDMASVDPALNATSRTANAAPKPNTPATPEYDRGGSGYQVTPFVNAKAFAGHRAKVLTQFGRRLEGKIVRVEQGVLHFEHRFNQGAATYKLRADQVEKLWVYRGNKG